MPSRVRRQIPSKSSHRGLVEPACADANNSSVVHVLCPAQMRIMALLCMSFALSFSPPLWLCCACPLPRLARSTHHPMPSRQGHLFEFSLQLTTPTRRSSRFGRARTASMLGEREGMRWPIAPTDEFVGVRIPLADCSDRRVRGCLDSGFPTSSWVSGFLGIWIPWVSGFPTSSWVSGFRYLDSLAIERARNRYANLNHRATSRLYGFPGPADCTAGGTAGSHCNFRKV
jgi:hypothetical protein